jgi:Tol biopolymer transport system component
VTDLATSSTTRITTHDSASWGASPSPDGSRIAFLTGRDGNYEIYAMDAGGGNAVNLTNHPDYDVLAVWSPDGTRIAFMSTRGFELGSIGPFPGHIYLMNSDGSNLEQVTTEPLTSSLGPGDWSPDGRFLLLSRDVDDQLDLFLLDVETRTERRLTTAPESEYTADFSSDGSRIAFHAETDSGSHIVIMNIDGSGRRTLTSGPGFRYSPKWSPDDSWLLFTVLGEGAEQYDLRAVRVDGSEERAIVATGENERDGTWVPVR